ncbi:MAG TPA: hypothetical protein VEF04_09380 [Blastocatellia bacterium]|nr:hypothetical protein [Blastocatellia bacterium]
MKVILLLTFIFAFAGMQTKSAKEQNQMEYLERRSAEYIIGKKVYSYEFTDDDLSRTPFWDISKKEPPPISMNQALDGTRSYLQKHFPNADQWIVDSIRLDLVGKRKWIYEIQYFCPENVCDESTHFSVIMKMDGKIIEHTITDKE